MAHLKKIPMHNFLLLGTLLLSTLAYSQGYKQKQFDEMLSGLLTHAVAEIEAKNTIYDSAVVYLDARELNEYQVSKIPSAQWVGYDDFNITRVSNIDENQEIIVYCSIGYRSEKVAEQLEANGFTNVTNMLGGIFEWVNYKNPVVDSINANTNKVHAFNKEWGKWLNNDLVEKIYK